MRLPAIVGAFQKGEQNRLKMAYLSLLQATPRYHSVACGPDLADQHKVGFFSLDRPSQTDVTEIVDLKEMTEVLQVLLQDVATLRRDINFAKHVMQADYQTKLQEKSLELYCRINERVTELEKMHEERVGTVRRAFRQQLSDAISRVVYLYDKNLQRKVKQEKTKSTGDVGKMEKQLRELQMTIQRNESIIHMLKMQIQQLQNKDPSITDSADDTTEIKTPSVNYEADALKDELESVKLKLDLLQDSLVAKDDVNTQLSQEIENLNEELARGKNQVENLKMENNSLRAAMEKDKASSKRLIQKQKEEMEKEMEERLRQAQLQSNAALEAEAKAKQASEREKMKFMMDQRKMLEEQLAKERAKYAEAMKGDTDINKLRKREEMLKEEVARLKKEIEKIHRTWEKKFAILQQSLHALKDESYIRQTLQRQAAALHHAAVSYSVDSPVGILPLSKQSSPSKRPLPDIQKFGKGFPSNTPQGPNEKDFISYTVSAPSGRGTAMFSADENQIMGESEKDDIPNDVVPLPDRPHRKQSRCSDGSRPTSKERARVVVVPRVPTQ